MKTINPIKTLTLLLMLTVTTILSANDTTKVDLTVGADLVSHYVWRGMLLGNTPAVQPSMGVSLGGFTLGSWASYSISPSAFQEVDLCLSYTKGFFTIGVNDYYNPNDSLGISNDYFNYGKSTSLHSFEPFITLSEIAGTPFSATAALFVYGNDRDELGKNLYSSYFELSYATNVKDMGLKFFCGTTFNKGYYAEKAALVNLGATISKELEITENFIIPSSGSFIINPDTKNIFLVFSVTF
jgi:hypothetical protein